MYLRYLWAPLFKALGGFVIVMILYWLFVDNVTAKSLRFVTVVAFLYTFLFYCLPILTLFISHRRAIRGFNLELSKGGFWKLHAKGNVYTSDDFKYVEKYLTVSKYHDRFDLSLWGHYYYYVLYSKNGYRIVLPCLLFDKDQKLNFSRMEQKKKLFPIPPHK